MTEFAAAETPKKEDEVQPPKDQSAVKPMTMKMLSVVQQQNPTKYAFTGGFQNLTFLTGVVVRPPGLPSNQFFLQTRKNDRSPLPILMPSGVKAPKNGTHAKVNCSVVGATDPDGKNYPVLICRSIEIPNALEAEIRRTIDLLKKDVDPFESARKQTSRGNTVHLSGVVVGRIQHKRLTSDGLASEFLSVTFLLRMDADPTHIIPVLCDKKLVEHASSKIQYGSIISVRGEYQVQTVNIIKKDADGKQVFTDDGKPVYELDEAGKVKVKYHPFIFLTDYPSNAPDKHLQFTDPEVMAIPAWIDEQINKTILLRSALGKQQNNATRVRKEEASSNAQTAQSLVSVEEFTRGASTDRDGGL